MTRVAIYARVSTSKQDTENQIRDLREYADRQGWEVTGEFRETEHGWEPDREKLKQLLSHAHERKFDLVLVWALDRFSRQGIGPTLQLLKRLNEYGTPLVSYKEPFLRATDPRIAELLLSVLSWVAEQEHLRISDRTKAGLARARAQGKALGRPRVYAFDPDTARTLRKRGTSWRGILDRLGLPEEALSSVRRVCEGVSKGTPKASRGADPVPAGVAR